MEFLGMEDIEDDPRAEIFPTVQMLEKEEHCAILLSETLLISSHISVRLKQSKMEIKKSDKVFVYVKEVMSFGLLYT